MASDSVKRKGEHLEKNICVICLSESADDLQKGTTRGLNRLQDAAKARYDLKDLKYQEAIERISGVTQSSLSAPVLVWLRKCYSEFTYKGKIERLTDSKCSSSNNSKRRKHSEEISDTVIGQGVLYLLWFGLCVYFVKIQNQKISYFLLLLSV